MTFRCTPLNSKQSLESNYMYISISCAFGHVSDVWPQNDLFGPRNDFFGPQIDLFEPQNDLFWPFGRPRITLSRINRIRIQFWIDSYAYRVQLAIFPIFDLEMTFIDPSDDLGWPYYAHHWTQNKILNRFICISCAFGHFSNFWPQNDLWDLSLTFFDPLNDLECSWHGHH